MLTSVPTQEDLKALHESRKAFALAAAKRLKEIEANFRPDACPLVTPYTRFLRVEDDVLRELYAVRRATVQDDVALPPMPKLRTHLDNGQPLHLRNYQKAMIAHLAALPRFVDGDGVGLGKTLCSIAAACAVDYKLGGGMKMIVLTTAATAYQWETEIKRFSYLKPWVLRDSHKFKGDKKKTYGHTARMMQLQKFLEHPDLDVLVCRYSQWMGRRSAATGAFDADGRPTAFSGKEHLSPEVRDFRYALTGHKDKLVLVLDEMHKIKNPDALIRDMVLTLQRKCGRVWGLTATALKNHLEEFYTVFSSIGVSPLGSLAHFKENYCLWEPIRAGGRPDYKIVGYTHLPQFKVGMRPWYWGRSQAQVGEKLPKLTTLYHPLELSKEQYKLLFEDIPSGAYVLPPTLKKVAGEWVQVDRDPTNMMTSLALMNAVSLSPALLDPNDLTTFHSPKLSPKESLLLDLLDGTYEGESVLVFTKFKSCIDRLEYLTKSGKFTQRKFMRITGDETGKTRERNRLLFQDPNSGYGLLFITSAGIEGINCQQATHLIALDMPWSWGDAIQLVGRMIRMASPHSACMLHILYALGTVDEYVIETLRSKKGVFERILGSAGTVGLLDEGDLSQDLENSRLGLEDESEDTFRDMLCAHAKKVGMRPYLFGKMLGKLGSSLVQKANKTGPKSLSHEDYDHLW